MDTEQLGTNTGIMSIYAGIMAEVQIHQGQLY